MEDLNITVGGTPLSFIHESWSADSLSWRYPHGSWELSFSLDVPFNWRHPDVSRGAEVVGWLGPTPVWNGLLTEPDFDSQQFVATGIAREAETALCLSSGGTLTTNPSEAVSAAITRGLLSWQTANTLPATSFADTDETRTFNYIADLLDAWSVSAGVNWLVDPYGHVTYSASPTAPTFYVTPGAGVLGVADDDYVTDAYARYESAAGVISSADRHSPIEGVKRLERGIDLTDRGIMTLAEAQAVLDGILAQAGARTGWTNGVQVGFGQVTTEGGTPVALSEVARACGLGAMVSLLGLFDERGSSVTTDIVIGEAVWNPGDATLLLNPVGLAARDLSSIVEAVGGDLL